MKRQISDSRISGHFQSYRTISTPLGSLYARLEYLRHRAQFEDIGLPVFLSVTRWSPPR